MTHFHLSRAFEARRDSAARDAAKHLRSILDWTLRGFALVLLASMLVTALHDESQAWDVAYYHMPFAGRLVGFLPPSEYLFHAANEARFHGFALLGELLQGVLWRVTGRPESANLVAFACVPLVAWFLARRMGVAWHLTVLSLLAIPLVQTHATSAYVDLPGNTAASILVLLVLEAYVSERPVGYRTLLLALLAAGIAANIKPMLHPLVVLALGALAARIARTRRRAPRARRPGPMLLVLTLALPVVFATPLKNAALHHNPYYPVKLTLLGHELPGPEDAYSSSPAWLEAAPRPVRFVCSLLEIGARPLRDPRRWTVDQWMPPDAAGYRMGGFFHAYVLAHLAHLAWRAWRDRSRAVVVSAVGFSALTVVTAFLPQSHELRYYMSWMIVLVAINLWLASRSGAQEADRGTLSLGLLAAAALGVVLAATRGVYAYPSGSTFAELVRDKVDARALSGIGEGERVCVQREPFDVLWAPVFHRPRRYAVQEAEEATDCRGSRRIE